MDDQPPPEFLNTFRLGAVGYQYADGVILFFRNSARFGYHRRNFNITCRNQTCEGKIEMLLYSMTDVFTQSDND